MTLSIQYTLFSSENVPLKQCVIKHGHMSDSVQADIRNFSNA
jgi:hypothetical protein